MSNNEAMTTVQDAPEMNLPPGTAVVVAAAAAAAAAPAPVPAHVPVPTAVFGVAEFAANQNAAFQNWAQLHLGQPPQTPVRRVAVPVSNYKDVFLTKPDQIPSPSDANPQEDSQLANLPLECLSSIVRYLDPDSIFNLLGSCRALLPLGKDTTTRIEFLINRFGLARAAEAMVIHSGLLNPLVFEGVCRRVDETLDKMPRFQLQRLYTRFSVLGRSDLLQALLTYGLATYPDGDVFQPASTTSRSGLSPASWDPEVFRQLASAPGLPKGTEYLLVLARGRDWLVPEDACLSAMQTLKHLYGMKPGLVPLTGGSTAARESLATQSDLFGRIGRDSRGHLADVFIPGTDALHALLTGAVNQGDELAVKRMLAFGVGTRPAIEAHDDGQDIPPRPGNNNAGPPPPYQRQLYIIARECQRRGTTSPYPLSPPAPRFRVLRLRQPVQDENAPKPNPLDAVECAASRGGNVDILRMVLEEDNKQNRWDTAEGRATLTKCLDMCRQNIECYDLVKAFLGGDVEPTIELMRAFLNGDQEECVNLLDSGVSLSWDMVAVLLKAPQTVALRQLLLESTNFDEKTLKSLLTELFRLCTHRDDTNAQEARQRHPAIVAVFERYDRSLKTTEGKKLLRTFFGDNCSRHLVRPYLGTMGERSPKSQVLQFDLKQAVIDNDEDSMRGLLDYGVKPSSLALLLLDLPRRVNAVGVPTVNTAGVATFLKMCKLSSSEIQTVFDIALQRNNVAVMRHLLDQTIGHKMPKINADSLKTALRYPDNQAQAFRTLIERLGTQDHIVKHWRSVDEAVQRQNRPEIVELWIEYKAKFAVDETLGDPVAENNDEQGGEMVQMGDYEVWY